MFPQNKENALGVGNYPMNTFMKGNELSRSPSRNAIGRRPMISPKKTDRPVSNLNGKQNSSANRMLKSSKGSKANK